MFERYTEKARRAIFSARYEAGKTGAREIGNSHLLLGVLGEHRHFLGDVPAADVFVESYRREITSDNAEEVPRSVDMPLSHPSKRVLAFGAEEAKLMGHKHISAEHIFLGLLREDRPIAVRLARDYGVEIGSFRERVAKAE